MNTLLLLLLTLQTSRPSTNFRLHLSQIDVKYAQLGGAQGFLGPALSNEQALPGGGRFRAYRGGAIYWSPGTRAYEVHGEIRRKWGQLGAQSGFLGYPTSDESRTLDAIGRYNQFQGGSIYWSPQTGAHEMHGDIRGKWIDLGSERGFLRYPTSDELSTSDGTGRFNHFQGGSIFWTSRTGAHEVHGPIQEKWAQIGWEKSSLGYPTSDEKSGAGGSRVSSFQNGRIEWTASGGAHVVTTITSPALTRALSNPQLINDLRNVAVKDSGVRIVRPSNVVENVPGTTPAPQLRPNEFAVARVRPDTLRANGRTRFLLPLRATVVSRSGAVFNLQPVFEPVTAGLQLTEDGNYSVRLLIGLMDHEKPDENRKLPREVWVQLTSDVATVEPTQFPIQHSNMPYQPVTVSGNPMRDSVQLTMTVRSMSSTLNARLPVLRPTVLILGADRAEGLGADRVRLTVSLGIGAGSTLRHVSLTAKKGTLKPESVTLSDLDPSAVIEYVPRFIGLDEIEATSVGLTSGRHRLSLAMPWLFLLSAVLGGGLGAFAVRLLRPNPAPAILGRYFVGGILMALLASCLYVLGINVTPVQLPVQNNPLAVFAMGAVGAIAAVPLVSKWSDGFKGVLEGPSGES